MDKPTSTQPNQKGGSKEHGSWSMKPAQNHNHWFGYGMAVLIFSTAFANMFLGGRIRNVMKAEMPKAAWRQTGKNTSEEYSSQSSKQQQQHQGQQGQQGRRQEQEWKETEDPYSSLLKDLSVLQSTHLRTLGLRPDDFNEKAIKGAYRTLVMTYHPDRIAADHPKREEYLKRFQSISHSYQVLLDMVKKSSADK